MGWIIPLAQMPILCSLLSYLTCQVEVFNFERKEEEKKEEILQEGRSETSPHVPTYTSPALTADTSLSIALFLTPSLGSSSLYLSVCVWLFLCPSSPPPSLYLFHCPLSLFTLQNPSLGIFIHCLPPSYLSFFFYHHSSSSCAGGHVR